MAHHEDVDFRVVASIGGTFLSIARPFLDQLAKGSQEGTESASQDPGRVVCTATLLALALELQLKAIRTGLRLPVQDTHDLWALYKTLPARTKAEIEGAFDQQLADRNPESLLTLQMRLRRANEHTHRLTRFGTDRTLPTVYTVPALLKRSANAFVAWRYIHESVPPGTGYSDHVFEHSHLRLLSETLAALLANASQAAQSTGLPSDAA